MERQVKSTGIPILECYTDFYNSGRGFFGFGINNSLHESDGSALEKARELDPQVNGSLILASENIAIINQAQGTQGKREVRRYESREVEFEGTHQIYWVVSARVTQGEVLVDYEMMFSRPDQSLSYLLVHTKKPEFRRSEICTIDAAKLRTRIDGLPVYFRIEDWNEAAQNSSHLISNAPRPRVLTLFRRNVGEETFDVKEGSKVQLAHTDLFQGRWNERWGFETKEGGTELDLRGVGVSLEGSWLTPRV